MSDMNVGNPTRTTRRRRETSPEPSAAPETPQAAELPPLGLTTGPDGRPVIVDMEYDDYVEAVRRQKPDAQIVKRSQTNPALIVTFN